MSVGFLVLVFTSIVDTVPLTLLVTNAVLPSGVIATPPAPEPTGMSTGFLVLVLTSMVDTVPLAPLATKAVDRHRPRAVTAATPPGTTPTSAPANPTTTTPRTHRNRSIPAPLPCCPHQLDWADQRSVRLHRGPVPPIRKRSDVARARQRVAAFVQ